MPLTSDQVSNRVDKGNLSQKILQRMPMEDLLA